VLTEFILESVYRETLDGLRQVGFRANRGIDDTGFLLLVWSTASGYYFGAIFTHCFSFMSQNAWNREAQMSARAS
jgi:hypothetical protein